MGFGKWIAGALGWAMFSPIGGILGFYFASRVEKLSEAAEEKFKAISLAYEAICKERGI